MFMVQVHTMPPVPAHHVSWHGTPVVVDVQGTGSGRIRVASHTNEYMGMLRCRVAKQLGCPSKQVRLFYGGKDVNHLCTSGLQQQVTTRMLGES